MIYALLTALYVFCAFTLAAYAIGAFFLLLAYYRHRDEGYRTPILKQYPKVCVQLPIYNERFVVRRLLDAVAAFDYPRDCLEIQVLDDSTDDTADITAAKVGALRRKGLNITHIRRGSRQGFKAGALAYGLTLTDAEYAAVFDADFVPPTDFLKRTIPLLAADPGLALVQTRWGHLNDSESALTMGQALALDGHFVVEQTARSRSNYLMNFNGSGGVWRITAIHDAGGWRDITLTEDLDLSYRAQLKGWRFAYLPDVVVPAEVPPTLSAYKQQQARWAKGGSQTLLLLIKPIWTHRRLTLPQRLMATMHLCQYVVHPVMITLILLMPPLVLSGSLQKVELGILGITGLFPPMIFVASQRALYPNWARRLMMLPALVVMGTGLAWSNSRAVMGGLLGIKEEFHRTPKYSDIHSRQPHNANPYTLKLNKNVGWELLLSLYALWGVAISLRNAPAFAPYLGLYSFAFAVMAIWGIREAWSSRRDAKRGANSDDAPNKADDADVSEEAENAYESMAEHMK